MSLPGVGLPGVGLPGVGLPGRDALPAGGDGANQAPPRPTPGAGVHLVAPTSREGRRYVGVVLSRKTDQWALRFWLEALAGLRGRG